jgi:hypothetical protein
MELPFSHICPSDCKLASMYDDCVYVCVGMYGMRIDFRNYNFNENLKRFPKLL